MMIESVLENCKLPPSLVEDRWMINKPLKNLQDKTLLYWACEQEQEVLVDNLLKIPHLNTNIGVSSIEKNFVNSF